MFPMNRRTRQGLLASTALLLVAAVATANLTPDEAPVEGPAITAAPRAAAAGWEYKALPRAEIVQMAPGRQGEYILPKDLLEDFNRGLEVLGSQGWELVAVEPYHKEGYVSWPALYTFRRPK